MTERSTMLLNIHALRTRGQSLSSESFLVTAGARCDHLAPDRGDGQGHLVRIDSADMAAIEITYESTVVNQPHQCQIDTVAGLPVTEMASPCLKYLLPSRYCESDRLGSIAAELFGHISHPLARASAISDWIFENIDYVGGSTNSTTSASDTLSQRSGVCRDFAHLAIAFCRAQSIPARYFSGYACEMQPPDFHACFEACVGNRWFVFDPTRMSSPNGLIRIGSGLDAADTSISTIFGSMELESMVVSCVADSFQPLSRADLGGAAIQLEPGSAYPDD